jgi:hypothetical protein
MIKKIVISFLSVLSAVFVIAIAPYVLMAGSDYNTDNYTTQGGSSTVIGGTLTIASGGTLTAASGSTVSILGTGAFNGTVGATTPSTGIFTTISTGQGAYELYKMDQNVDTTASPTFVGITATTVNATTFTGALVGNADTATNALQWSGVSTNLVAATGRTSLGLGTMALETTANPTITTINISEIRLTTVTANDTPQTTTADVRIYINGEAWRFLIFK